MTVTLAQLGARVIRKLGVAIVADASRPSAAATTTVAAVAARVLLEIGIPVADADRPAPAGTTSQAELAARALRAVGQNPAGIAAFDEGTTYTLAEVATAALLKLAVIAPDETPSAPDQADALIRATSVHDSLAALDYVLWNPASIPAAVFEFYVIMTANLIAPGHGKPASMEAYTAAQAMVRQVALSGANGQALAAAKVVEAHERLNARGLVSWPVTAVPVGQAEDYVQLTAALLAPIYGYQQDAQGLAAWKAAMDAAEASIHRAALVRGAAARVTDNVTGVIDELNALGLAPWDGTHIPASLSDPIVAVTVMQMGEFGKEIDPKAYEFAQNRVRRVAMGGAAGQALAQQKVIAVQASLEARGIARWTLFDVPVEAEEPIVLKAATLLAPEVGEKADPSWAEMAERELLMVTSLPTAHETVRAVYF